MKQYGSVTTDDTTGWTPRKAYVTHWNAG